MSSHATTIAANLSRVRERIAAAARRGGRRPEEIKLVAVTKYVDSQMARAVFDAGCQDLGESRPQELWKKAADLADLPVHWHLIGHLQRNKVRRSLSHISLLHAGDSLRLLEELDREAAQLSTRFPVLLEVNVSGEETKHGFTPAALEQALPQISALSRLEIRGLMAMAGIEGDLEDARRDFRSLRQLRDHLRLASGSQLALNELSMGMSGDLEAAVEEGATMVRVGSALFEGVET